MSTFIRELEVQVNETTTEVLKLSQKTIGDVNCVVWDAAIVLAKYLEKQHFKNKSFTENKKVLELGSGVGCVGLTSALLGSDVILTDLPEALPITEENVSINGPVINAFNGKLRVQKLSWDEPCEEYKQYNFDKILLADCVYYKESVQPLVDTLVALSNEKTEILQSQEIRDSGIQREVWSLYNKTVEKYFSFKVIPKEEQHEDFSCEEITLLRLIKK